ncbi:hybrid sensor histidine kinase/response regulator [Glaciimonas soli]|uniref:Sensory/regulatory protein RpfC n=1 Tax=Glaciimonas soli TaxID=2590999 RepID=A0A843YRQ4_9BURK|nr:hybrid sensor histidine kinase/response regulator [Glaciimonas soli]MQR02235.1 response regulator [Glaciimonas soli]
MAAEQKNRVLKLLGRYQRTLLFGGGAVLSLVIVLLGALDAWMQVKDNIADSRTVVQQPAEAIRRIVLIRQTYLRGVAYSAEVRWKETPKSYKKFISTLAAQGGRGILPISEPGERVFIMTTGAGQSTQAASQSLNRYLAITEVFCNFSNDSLLLRKANTIESNSAYIYAPDNSFVAIYPYSKIRNIPEKQAEQVTAAQIQRITARFGNFKDADVNQRLLASRATIWLPPMPGPADGENIIAMVQPAFANGVPFLIFSSNISTSVMQNILNQAPPNSELAILDQKHHILLETEQTKEAGASLATQLVNSPAWHSNVPLSTPFSYQYTHGIFSTTRELSDLGWTLMYAYSWRTIFSELKTELISIMAAVLLTLALLWTFLLLFNRKVLTPLYHSSQRVFESENLNRTIINTAPVGLALLTAADGTILLQNDVMSAYASRLHDVSLSQKLMQTYRQKVSSSGSINAAEKDSALNIQEVPIAFATEHGNTTHLLANIVETRYQGIDTLLCAFTDITAGKQIEQKLEEARQAANDANSAKSTFLATMSHEIRTPLNAILGNLELLGHAPLSIEQDERLGIITASSNSLLSIINDILDLSKVESRQMILEQVPFALTTIFQDVVAIFTTIATSKGIRLSCIVEPEIAPLYRGDPTRLRQIVTNLVSNAIKFTSAGGVIINVYSGTAVNAETGVAMIVIRVSDTGIGIAQTSVSTLFDAYMQADNSINRRFGGTGLGLALCQRLTQLMGGTITVESTLNVGSTFTVTLPLHIAQAGDEIATVDHVSAISDGNEEEDEYAAITVLVAEDHPFNRTLLRDQLTLLGCEADIVENGLEALRAFGEEDYDIVLTDLNMPVMSGYALATCLRDQRNTIPIIAISAHTTPEERQRCIEVGITDIVIKPISLMALDKVLHKYIPRYSNKKIHQGVTLAPAAISQKHTPFTQDMITLLHNTTAKSLVAIRHAITQQDSALAKSEFHSIKGAFAMAKMPEVAQLCQRMEGFSRSDDWAQILSAMPELETAIHSALAALAENI